MIERRFTKGPPIQIEKRDDGSRTIVGYGAVFYDPTNPGTEYELYRDVFERVGPQAFSRAIAEKHDCRGLFNHDPNHVLGRTSAGTQRLSVDSVGLRYEIDIPDTQLGRDLCLSIERGDISGSSFSFCCTKRTWTEEAEGREVTVIEDLDLYDVGPVTFPAYEATTSSVRSKEIEESREAWKRSRAEEKQEVLTDLASRKLSLKEKEILC